MPVRERVRVHPFPAGQAGVSRVKREFQADSDINAIMRKYVSHGVPPQMVDNPGVFGDFSGTDDFMTMNLKVIAARNAFMQLPAHVRAHFKNDPALLLDAVHDPERKAELVKLGLAKFNADETAFIKELARQDAARKAQDAADLELGRKARADSVKP